MAAVQKLYSVTELANDLGAVVDALGEDVGGVAKDDRRCPVDFGDHVQHHNTACAQGACHGASLGKFPHQQMAQQLCRRHLGSGARYFLDP